LSRMREVRAMSGPPLCSPPFVPEGFDVDVYVVLEDFGRIGRAYRPNLPMLIFAINLEGSEPCNGRPCA
jgi:hypothetical protein